MTPPPMPDDAVTAWATCREGPDLHPRTCDSCGVAMRGVRVLTVHFEGGGELEFAICAECATEVRG